MQVSLTLGLGALGNEDGVQKRQLHPTLHQLLCLPGSHWHHNVQAGSQLQAMHLSTAAVIPNHVEIHKQHPGRGCMRLTVPQHGFLT
jgi:hypothetical protein